MIYFICPDTNSFISGGNLFNQQIFDGLTALTFPYRRIDFEQWIGLNMRSQDILVFDSIYLKNLNPASLHKVVGRKMLLIHLLPSMINPAVNVSEETELLKSFDVLIANSPFTKDYLTDHLNLNGNIKLIQPWIKKVKHQDALTRDKIIIVANWYPAKQYDLLIQQLIETELPEDLKINIYGDTEVDPPYFKYCLSLLNQFPLLKDRLIIEGLINPELLQKVYSETFCLLEISAFETYGLAVAEAILADASVLTLGNGNCKQFIGEGKCLGCSSIQDLVNKLILLQKEELNIESQPVIHIISEKNKFEEQLIPVFGPG